MSLFEAYVISRLDHIHDTLLVSIWFAYTAAALLGFGYLVEGRIKLVGRVAITALIIGSLSSWGYTFIPTSKEIEDIKKATQQ